MPTNPTPAGAPETGARQERGTIVAYLWQSGSNRQVALSLTGDPPELEPWANTSPGGDWDEVNLIFDDAPPYPPEPTPGLWRLEMDWHRLTEEESEERVGSDELCCIYEAPFRWTLVDPDAILTRLASAEQAQADYLAALKNLKGMMGTTETNHEQIIGAALSHIHLGRLAAKRLEDAEHRLRELEADGQKWHTVRRDVEFVIMAREESDSKPMEIGRANGAKSEAWARRVVKQEGREALGIGEAACFYIERVVTLTQRENVPAPAPEGTGDE